MVSQVPAPRGPADLEMDASRVKRDSAWASTLPDRDFCDGESNSAQMPAPGGEDARKEASAVVKRHPSSRSIGRRQTAARRRRHETQRNLRRTGACSAADLAPIRLTRFRGTPNANRHLTLGGDSLPLEGLDPRSGGQPVAYQGAPCDKNKRAWPTQCRTRGQKKKN